MAGMFQDDKGNTSSGRLQTTATVFVGLGLATILGIGEWRGKSFSENMFILTGALTIGGAGMKGFQKFSEREAKPAPASSNPQAVPVNPQTAPVLSSTKSTSASLEKTKLLTAEEELKVVLQEGW